MTNTFETTVLVVEDQRQLAEAYTAILETRYEVRTALGGMEALEKIDDEVDVVLLDRRMPGMSGDEVLSEFVERGLSPKVAMLTAVEPDTDIVDMPFDDYRRKPIDNEELLGLVETLLRWNEYDAHSQEFFRLAAKKRALELADKETTDSYHELVERMEEQREYVEETLDDVLGDSGLDTDE